MSNIKNIRNIKNLFRDIIIGNESIDYYLVQESMRLHFDAVSRVIGHGFYIIDHKNDAFSYVSPNRLFLCGYSVEEAADMKLSFFEKIMPPEDFEIYKEISEKSIEFNNQQPIEYHDKMTLSFDVRLIHPNNRYIYTNFRITPIMLNSEGKPWLSLGLVSLAPQQKSGNAFIINEEFSKRYEYSFKSKKWSLAKNLELTTREREILIYSAQGFSNEEIAEKLFIDVNTVKFHKRKIFELFDVKNIIEALRFAYNYKLF